MSAQLDNFLARLKPIPEEAHKAFSQALDENQLNQIKSAYIGKQGVLKEIMGALRELPPEDRPVLGQSVNGIRKAIEEALEARKEALREEALNRDLLKTSEDLTLPATRSSYGGAIHPIRRVQRDLLNIFRDMGFSVAQGPDVETDFNCFEALNFPPDHPARDMQDTLLMKNGHLLRTHTSCVQIRTMMTHDPPIRVVAPGTVYRCDDDVTHSPMFHQIEGLMVDKGVSMAHLKSTLIGFINRLFGDDVEVRLRPSFFPFTEPSCEIDIRRSGGDWMEVLGAGMVDPNVFKSVGYDPEVYTGFAFGLGIDRIAMLRYGINNIRRLFENDVRFLKQF